MIVAEKRMGTTIGEMELFGETMPDGRLTAPSHRKVYRLREAILQSKKLGRPLTEDEMKRYEV